VSLPRHVFRGSSDCKKMMCYESSSV
jgi:hypothetical protein